MQFEALVAIVTAENEELALDIAKEAGAGSATVLKGKNLGLKEEKVFFGLTFEEDVSILLFILPRKLTLNILKALRDKLDLDNKEKPNGIVMSMPITHLTGIDTDEIKLFEDEIIDIL